MATYAFSDLHANYDLWLQIKEFIKPTDRVFCLGDCVDRGSAGLEILYEVLATPNITLLKGNHEDFIEQIGKYTLTLDDPHFIHSTNLGSLWFSNGAENTIDDFLSLTKAEQLKLIQKMRELPIEHTYISESGNVIHLSHAGKNWRGRNVQKKQRNGLIINSLIWDRDHIYCKDWDGRDNEYCIHGHTPIQYLHHFLPAMVDWPKTRFEIFKYCEDHKIDIDLGSMDTYTTCLLDLDTLEPIYFKDRTQPIEDDDKEDLFFN